MADAPHAEDQPVDSSGRVFLVVADETKEMHTALRFACRRALHTNGRVALLTVIEPVQFQHWLGVGRRMEDDARASAERRMRTLAADVQEQTGCMPVVHIREGKPVEELLKLIDEDPTISLLVLGTKSGANDPGPIVTYLMSVIGRSKINIPVTLVPGQLSDEQIDALS